MFHGAMTAMITPFRNGQVDFDRLGANVRFQIAEGIDGLVPVGTTGESPTLSHAEHRAVIEKVVEVAAGKVPVIAGTGSNSTEEALDLTKHAHKVGASAALMVNPYYNRPTQEGLYRHFMTIADAVDLPIVLYNIPGRTGVTMEPATVARLAKHARIVAIKEATGSMDIASEILSLCGPERMTILSGDDSLTLPLMALGGKGVISVVSNIIPKRVKALAQAALGGDYATARKMHLELFPIFDVMFIEVNPVPVKAAMQMAGLDTGELRLPLCEIAGGNRAELEKVLRETKILH